MWVQARGFGGYSAPPPFDNAWRLFMFGLPHRPYYITGTCYARSLHAPAFCGVSGYGADVVLHSSKMLDLSTNLPLKIEAVDSEAKIDSVLPEICEVVEKGLVEVSDTLVIRCDANRQAGH